MIENKKGISLIVLIITIIVVIILAGAVLLNLSDTNVIDSAEESVILNDVGAFKVELDLYQMEKYMESNGSYYPSKLNANVTSASYDGNNLEGMTMYDMIPSMENKSSYIDFEIVDGELKYIGNDTDIQNILEENGFSTLSEIQVPEGEVYNVLNDTDEDGYKEIWYLEQLAYISEDVSGKYELMRNLDFNSDDSYLDASTNKSNWTTGTGWDSVMFGGSFDGNNYKLSNLYINQPTYSDIGLFRCVNNPTNAIVENFNIINCNIIGNERIGGLFGLVLGNLSIVNSSFYGDVTGNEQVGGFVGYSDNELSVNNSYVKGNIIGYNPNGESTFQGEIGGLVGQVSEDLIVNSSYFEGNITSKYSVVGGLVAYVSNNLIINNSYVDGNISSDERGVGGLVASVYGASEINSSYFEGDISSEEGDVGGLVSDVYDGLNISNSYVKGNINGNDYAGGLVGATYGGNLDLSGSHFKGIILGADFVGGLVGSVNHNLTINNSFVEGDISGNNKIGGLVGPVYEYLTINNSYFVGDVSIIDSGNEYIGGLVSDVYDGLNISNSYVKGNINGNDYAGGLVGATYGDTAIVDTYLSANVSGIGTNVSEFIGFYTASLNLNVESKTEEELKHQLTYIGWDFENIWDIEEGVNSATLR